MKRFSKKAFVVEEALSRIVNVCGICVRRLFPIPFHCIKRDFFSGIRTALLESEEHVCYTCKQSDVSPDNLIANKFLRQVTHHLSAFQYVVGFLLFYFTVKKIFNASCRL